MRRDFALLAGMGLFLGVGHAQTITEDPRHLAEARTRAEQLSRQGQNEAAANLLQTAIAANSCKASICYKAMYELAGYEALAGHTAEALQSLHVAESNGNIVSPTTLFQNSAFVSLHNEPAFGAILAESRREAQLWNVEPGEDHPTCLISPSMTRSPDCRFFGPKHG